MSFYLFIPNLSGFCIVLRFVFSSFVLLAERIWASAVSHALSAAPLSQGIVQASTDSSGIQWGFLNFKVKLNPMHKRNLNICHSSPVSQLYFHKKILSSHWLIWAVKCIDFEINYSNVTFTLVHFHLCNYIAYSRPNFYSIIM